MRGSSVENVYIIGVEEASMCIHILEKA